MKNFYRVMVCIMISGLIFCSNLWAKNSVAANDVNCDNGFICHTIEKRDIGWTYFSLAYGVPVSDLRKWNSEISAKGIDHFPVGAVIRYKTRKMIKAEIENSLTKKISDAEKRLQKDASDLTVNLKNVDEAVSDLEDQSETFIFSLNSLKRRFVDSEFVLSDLQQKFNKSKSFFLICASSTSLVLLVVLFFVVRIKKTSLKMKDNMAAIGEVVFGDSIIVNVHGEKFSFSPVMEKGEKFVCPFLKDGQMKRRLFLSKKDLKRSLISSLKKMPKLFDAINNDSSKFGKIKNLNPGRENFS